MGRHILIRFVIRPVPLIKTGPHARPGENEVNESRGHESHAHHAHAFTLKIMPDLTGIRFRQWC
jgi:hypothetical protein